MRSLRVFVMVLITAGTAAADPSTTSTSVSTSDPVLKSTPLVLRPLSLFDTPTPTLAPSLRIESARVAAERYANDWRYPEPGAIVGVDSGGWFLGHSHYRPRSARSAALHAGSIGATLLGEVLLSTGSPLAGLGALATGATLDAAAADVERDTEAGRKR
jgi:hypothetical protein